MGGVEQATTALVARLRAIGLLPVVELARAEDAVPLARALIAGGLPCIEITLRTPEAAAGIAAVRAACPEILLGAGTVLSLEQLEGALAAGADFAVAPGTNAVVVEASLARGLPMLPGVATPSEVEAARALGLRTVKLFPAELLGGADYIGALCGPYRDIGFVPTGSITPATLPGYLALPQVVACGGSWMVRPALVAAGEFDTIRELAAEAVRGVRAVRP
ncbi:MAG TPA: bifunctional 4-hydroxy-2-oxoglutarate aldolase/2-dehydro-3-deoxy-phosphogluconate aldolase [Gaiellales bacterium]|jgi:2-dehydro-3-deoxyphosphogluconate aldolase/(4S)-4-hydroxy-2-oxoglutarate aldolase